MSVTMCTLWCQHALCANRCRLRFQTPWLLRQIQSKIRRTFFRFWTKTASFFLTTHLRIKVARHPPTGSSLNRQTRTIWSLVIFARARTPRIQLWVSTSSRLWMTLNQSSSELLLSQTGSSISMRLTLRVKSKVLS